MLESLARMVTLAAGAPVLATVAACVGTDITFPWGPGEPPPETQAVVEVGAAECIVEIADADGGVNTGFREGLTCRRRAGC